MTPEPAIEESINSIRAAAVVAMHMTLGGFKDDKIAPDDGVDWKGLYRALIFADKALRVLAESDSERLGRVLAARTDRYLGDNTLHAAWCAVFEQDNAGRFLGQECTCGAITDY